MSTKVKVWAAALAAVNTISYVLGFTLGRFLGRRAAR